MARVSRTTFLAIAVVFHLIYIFSIFDIYFVSPIVSGMRSFRVESHPAPAQRLVLFVGDGLRADKAFQSFPDPSPSAGNSSEALTPRPLAPFIRSRVLEHGTFGVSHTRVPTESRPGHVALIAGLYEDVSAVTTGWKLNPVNFDSVFNRSRHTWSWGSPDILPMFKEGAVPGRVDADAYPPEFEDFSADATALDIYVFEHVKQLFEDAKVNKTLDAELRKDKNVFFLHLLGLDTAGHAYRPYSKEYLHNIQVVDKGVQEVTELIEEFYNDDKTAFVFTADHGMSDWGSHGDGHPDNTRTPLVVWGAGVAKPVRSKNGKATGHEDGFSHDWGFDQVQRNDVSQADVATLMAYLAGTDYPVNSVGELPLAFLAATPAEKVDALVTNAKEILEMYRIKEEQKLVTEIRYKPFAALGDSEHSPAHRIAEIEALSASGKHDEAIEKCTELIKLAIDGLRYLQTYDWLFLRTLVTIGYLGWMGYALATAVDLHILHGSVKPSRTSASNIAFSSILVLLYSILFIQRSSWTYYGYAIFPVIFWEEIWAKREAVVKGSNILFSHMKTPADYVFLAIKVVASLALLEGLVQSYHHREIYTLCYNIAVVWPWIYGEKFISENLVLLIQWGLCCVVMSIFTLLPAIKAESISLILLGGILMLAVGLLCLTSERSLDERKNTTPKDASESFGSSFSRNVLGAQVGLIVLAMIVTKSSVASLQARQGLPLGAQIVGWIVLVSSLLMPFLHSLALNSYYLHRLVVIFLTFAPAFIILTISYEGLFYLAYSMTVLTWVRLEHKIHLQSQVAPTKPTTNGTSISSPTAFTTDISTPAARDHLTDTVSQATNDALIDISSPPEPTPPPYRSLGLSDIRIALFFLFLLQSAFFSTGNIASISSFSLDAVYRLIPVFDPFSQGALLLLKLLIPFVIISAGLGILNRRLGVAPSALFMLVTACSEVMTIGFFYRVRDEGSWLDIGTSISHFAISSLLGVFVSVLELGGEWLVGGVEFDEEVGSVEKSSVNQPERSSDGNGKVNGKEVGTEDLY